MGLEGCRLSKEERKTFSFDPVKLGELFDFYELSGEFFDPKMRLFIDKLYDKMLLYKKSLGLTNQSGEQKPDMNEILCNLRIEHKSVYYCVNHPPKMVKLETLEICKVCRALFRGLTDHTKALAQEISKPEKPSETSDSQAWRHDSTKKLDKYGMVYCHDGGLWVFPSKCDDCKKKTYANYSDCQRRRTQEIQPSRESDAQT
jgi:hypothetical protein